MSINLELATKALERIEADPEAWNQSAWHDSDRSKALGRPVGCFALHVVLAAGLELAMPFGSSEATVASEATDALGFERRVEELVDYSSYDIEAGEYATVEAEVATGLYGSIADISTVAQRLLLGAKPEAGTDERRVYDKAYRRLNPAFGGSNSVEQIKEQLRRAELAELDEFRIYHETRGQWDGDSVTVLGEDAVKGFLANLDVATLSEVRVERVG